jgi:hypothetical protein
VGAGFRIFKVGEEALIDLADFDTTGPGERTCATRSPVAARTAWSSAGSPTASRPRSRPWSTTWKPSTWPGARRRAHRWASPSATSTGNSLLAARVRGGQLHGRALAFTTFRKTGVDGGWVLDLMRRAPDGPPGAVEACIAEGRGREFRTAGARTLSLGLAPLGGLDTASPVFEERVLAYCGNSPIPGMTSTAWPVQEQVRSVLDPALRGHPPPPRSPRFRDRPAADPLVGRHPPPRPPQGWQGRLPSHEVGTSRVCPGRAPGSGRWPRLRGSLPAS